MKKVLFLMILPFLLLGTASVSAQVRIGGSGTPHSAAVLDLNADNETTPSGNRRGLALPRVALTENNMQLNGVPPVNGMLVYHTGSTLDGAGVYVWMTDKWVKASTGYTGSTSIALDDGSFKRKALTGDVTANENSNETIIANDAVTSEKIKNGEVTQVDLSDNSVTSFQIVDSTIIGNDIAAYEIEEVHLADAAVTARTLNAMGAQTGDLLFFDGTTWAPSAASRVTGDTLLRISREDGEIFPLVHGEYSIVGCNDGTSGKIWMAPTGPYLNNLGEPAWDRKGRLDHMGLPGKIICGYAKRCVCYFQLLTR
jgi:predicted RNA-binding protein